MTYFATSIDNAIEALQKIKNKNIDNRGGNKLCVGMLEISPSGRRIFDSLVCFTLMWVNSNWEIISDDDDYKPNPDEFPCIVIT